MLYIIICIYLFSLPSKSELHVFPEQLTHREGLGVNRSYFLCSSTVNHIKKNLVKQQQKKGPLIHLCIRVIKGKVKKQGKETAIDPNYPATQTPAAGQWVLS